MTGRAVAAGPVAVATVAPVFLVRLVAEAARRKIDLRPLFRGFNIERADLEIPGAMISHHEAVTVVRRALPLLAIAERGLELGMRTRVTERGALALGLLAAATLGDSIQLLLRYPQSAGCLVQIREVTSEDGLQLIAEPYLGDQDVQSFLVDLTFTASVVLCRQATATHCKPSAVEFVREAPANAVAYKEFFGCPVRFGCLQNVLFMPAPQVAAPLPWANTMAYQLSLQLLERELEALTRLPALGYTVARALRRCLPRIAPLSEVAVALNVSERTLRRQLADAGLSYRALLDDSRKSRALDLMTGRHRSVSQVAKQAGFSDARSFARAFKRWTGHSPSVVKDQLAPADPAPVPPLD